MDISIIVAIAENSAIGKDNKLLWHLPQDLKRFKKITTGHTIIMGRKTFESIGKPLPNRRSIVITRNQNIEIKGVEIVHSLREAIAYTKGESEVFIIGGGKIYEESLPLVNRLYLTTIHANFEADTFFPKINREHWQVIEKEIFPTDEKNTLSATFEILERKQTHE